MKSNIIIDSKSCKNKDLLKRKKSKNNINLYTNKNIQNIRLLVINEELILKYKILIKNNFNNYLIFNDNIKIYVNDLIRLIPYNYLNDANINFYLNLLKNKYIKSIFRSLILNQNNAINLDNITIYSTFFYYFYYLECKVNTIIFNKYNIYTIVNNYLNSNSKFYKNFIKKNPFDSNDIFIPKHQDQHWTLIYIEGLNKFINNIKISENKFYWKNTSICINIYYLDSLYDKINNNYKLMFKYIIIYFIFENLNLIKNYDTFLFLTDYINFNFINVPKQNNEYDCGICILEFIENIIINKNKFIKLYKNFFWFQNNYFYLKRNFLLNIALNFLIYKKFEYIVDMFVEMIGGKICWFE